MRQFLKTLVCDIGFTWLLSLPTWGSMWMGYPAPWTVLWSAVVRQGDKASCQALSCPIVLPWVVASFRGVQSPWVWIFHGVLIVWVPMLPNLTWSKPFFPGHTCPISKPSWCLCVYPWLSYYVKC
jgi:hypothetical protein